jgi:hypothetical protein
MAVGSLLFRLIRSNAVVTVEAGTAASAGGTVLTWATAEAGVDVIVSNVSASRDFESGTYNVRGTCTVSGRHPALARPDVRLKVTSAGRGLQWIEGLYLSITGGTPHARGGAGLVQERVTLQATILEIPGIAGTEI